MAEFVTAQLLATSGKAALRAAAIIMAEGGARTAVTLPFLLELPLELPLAF